MMYLSRGVPVDAPYKDEIRVFLYGKSYALGPRLGSLWHNAKSGPKPVTPNDEYSIQRMAQSGLVVVTEETSEKLAAYRLLSQCILCPDRERRSRLPLMSRDKRLWTWICKAGLHLTTCELIRLEDRRLLPVPSLLGEANRRALTEVIYTSQPAEDDLLVTAMEHSPERDATVSALLRLLRANCLFLT